MMWKKISLEDSESGTPAEKELVQCECECCFLNFQYEKKKQFCGWCEEALPDIVQDQYLEIRINRIIAVMDKARMNRFPDVIQLIWKYIRTKK